MASKRKAAKRDVGAGGGRLTHNPFAALRASGDDRGEPSKLIPDEASQGAGRGAEGPASSGPARGFEEPLRQPREHHLEVRREKKGRGGKVVTLVTWRTAAPTSNELEALTRRLARALGAGARAGDGTITVQGDLSARVGAALEAELGGSIRITWGTR